MKPETHKLQEQPPEGDRDLIDRELARQDEKLKKDGKTGSPAGAEGAKRRPES